MSISFNVTVTKGEMDTSLAVAVKAGVLTQSAAIAVKSAVAVFDMLENASEVSIAVSGTLFGADRGFTIEVTPK